MSETLTHLHILVVYNQVETVSRFLMQQRRVTIEAPSLDEVVLRELAPDGELMVRRPLVTIIARQHRAISFPARTPLALSYRGLKATGKPLTAGR